MMGGGGQAGEAVHADIDIVGCSQGIHCGICVCVLVVYSS